MIQKVYQAIELLKANRITIFKLFSDVDNQIKEIGDASGSQIQVSRELLAQRDEKLKEWIDKLQENQLTIDNYLEQHAYGKEDIENSIKQLQESLDGTIQPKMVTVPIKKNDSGT